MMFLIRILFYNKNKYRNYKLFFFNEIDIISFIISLFFLLNCFVFFRIKLINENYLVCLIKLFVMYILFEFC